MTQDERWHARFNEVMEFLEVNKRKPSKFVDSERGMRNWWKQQQKLVNAGMLKPERMEAFKKLVEVGEKYRHVNQWK